MTPADRTATITRWWSSLLRRFARARPCDDCGRPTTDYLTPRGALCDACAIRRSEEP